MAKIGNEARLILKLAQERAKAEKAMFYQKHHDEGHRVSDFAHGIDTYETVLDNVVLEIEGR